jgi:hypothetical protein
MHHPAWETYIQAPISPEKHAGAQDPRAPAYEEHRKHLSRFIAEHDPRRIGCLGSGFLTDFPVQEFLGGNREVFLIDWVPSVSPAGFRNALIRREGNIISCMVCETSDDPETFCKGYRTHPNKDLSICANFRLVNEPNLYCGNYLSGEEPRFIAADVTGGRSSWFGERISEVVSSSKTPEEAFRAAINLCGRAASVRKDLPIEEGSLDLVTSSMVVSQFDHEPYTYFAKVLASYFGREAVLRKEKTLLPLMDRLRGEIFQIQVDGHVRELHRLVEKSRGKVYFSVELFRTVPDRGEFFLVQEIPKAMEAFGRHFLFDFELIPPGKVLLRADASEGVSLVQSYFLTPKR